MLTVRELSGCPCSALFASRLELHDDGRVRELVYLVATSIDGFIATPDGDFTPLLVEGEHLDELVRRFPETFPVHVRELLGITAENQYFDTVLMGAGTYRVPGAPASPYPHLKQLVVTRHPESLPPEIVAVQGPLDDHVADLKRQDGRAIWLCGGSDVAGQLLPSIDRLVLKISPVVLGRGLPLFGTQDPVRTFFEPVSHEAFANGVEIVEYRPRPGAAH